MSSHHTGLEQRLRHAFADLEVRVMQTIDQKTPEATPGRARRSLRLALGVALAASLIVVVAAISLLRAPEGGNEVVTPQPSTTEATLPTTTLPVTTVASSQAPTNIGTIAGAAIPESAIVNPVFGAAVVGGDGGVYTIFPDEAIEIIPSPVRSAYATANLTFVYQERDTGRILIRDSDGGTTPWITPAEEQTLLLQTVITHRGMTWIAYTIREPNEFQEFLETLYIASYSAPSEVIELGVVGDVESGLFEVSSHDGVVLAETIATGFTEYQAWMLDGSPAAVAGLPSGMDGCSFGEPSCPFHVHLIDGNRVGWIEADEKSAELVIGDRNTGSELHRVVLGVGMADVFLARVESAGSTSLVTVRTPDSRQLPSLLVEFEAGIVLQLPRSGTATIPR